MRFRGPGGVGVALSCLVLAAPARGEPVYEHAAVAADHVFASHAGVEMLRRGGNAVDAAVAASFCLSVVRPFSCGIGGGGFMVLYDPDGAEAVALDYRETAPAAVDAGYFARLDDEGASVAGLHAAGVPGTVAGLLWALERHGTLDRVTVLEPAIRAAEEGFLADASHVEAARKLAERLARHPHLRDPAEPIWADLCLYGHVEVGDVLRNPEQARALRLIAEQGRDAFYRGPIGEAIVAAMRAGGGPMTAGDLAAYAVRPAEPLRGSFRGFEVLAMPPPSSGGVAMLQVLGILERRLDDLGEPAPGTPPYIHLVVEAMKHAFADRAAWLADSAFAEVPVSRLLSSGYLDERAAGISLEGTRPRFHYGSVAELTEDGGTSHVSVVDARGMAVACTETINLEWGSMVAVPGFGFALNDQMDDFTTVPGRPNAFGLRQSDRNRPQPGKRPLSSMSPTIVLERGRPVIVAGASGGPRIISGTLQCMLNCLLFDMAAGPAVAAPRFHHQWVPDLLQFEEGWADETSVDAMSALGHETGRRTHIGVVQLIRVTPEGIQAASDPRKGGRPAGY